MRVNWRRVTRTMRLGGLAVILVLLGIVVYNVYDFWHDKVGDTPSKAIESYFSALATGDYEQLYRLTAKSRLTDIYGRPVTQSEFLAQAARVTGGRQIAFRNIEITKLNTFQGSQFYIVTLHSSLPGASSARLVVEVLREDKRWVVVYPFAIML